jgi:recombination protein RecT
MNDIVKQESPSQKMARFLDASSVKKQFENVLKESSGSFMASIIECYNDKAIAGCEPSAVIIEAMKAASLKLPLNKSLGYAYLVAYKNVPVFIIGYKGLTQLALRTGYYKHLNTGVVYEGQIKSQNFMTGEMEFNQPDCSKPVIGYFAYLELVNGFRKFIYTDKESIVSHAKKYSKSYGSEYSPWKTEFESMAKKTVLRDLLSHWGYMSVEMANALNSEEVEPSEPTYILSTGEVLPNSQPLPEAKKEQIEAEPGF